MCEGKRKLSCTSVCIGSMPVQVLCFHIHNDLNDTNVSIISQQTKIWVVRHKAGHKQSKGCFWDSQDIAVLPCTSSTCFSPDLDKKKHLRHDSWFDTFMGDLGGSCLKYSVHGIKKLNAFMCAAMRPNYCQGAATIAKASIGATQFTQHARCGNHCQADFRPN